MSIAATARAFFFDAFSLSAAVAAFSATDFFSATTFFSASSLDFWLLVTSAGLAAGFGLSLTTDLGREVRLGLFHSPSAVLFIGVTCAVRGLDSSDDFLILLPGEGVNFAAAIGDLQAGLLSGLTDDGGERLPALGVGKLFVRCVRVRRELGDDWLLKTQSHNG